MNEFDVNTLTYVCYYIILRFSYLIFLSSLILSYLLLFIFFSLFFFKNCYKKIKIVNNIVIASACLLCIGLSSFLFTLLVVFSSLQVFYNQLHFYFSNSYYFQYYTCNYAQISYDHPIATYPIVSS